jgi:hypothetical protein
MQFAASSTRRVNAGIHSLYIPVYPLPTVAWRLHPQLERVFQLTIWQLTTIEQPTIMDKIQPTVKKFNPTSPSPGQSS